MNERFLTNLLYPNGSPAAPVEPVPETVPPGAAANAIGPFLPHVRQAPGVVPPPSPVMGRLSRSAEGHKNMSIATRLVRLERELEQRHPQGPFTQEELNRVPNGVLFAVQDVVNRYRAELGGRELSAEDWDHMPPDLARELETAVREARAKMGR